MQLHNRKSLSKAMLIALSLMVTVLMGNQCPLGLNPVAVAELQAAGVDKYLGEFTPVSSELQPNGWVKHVFDTDGGNGPICIVGSPFTSFTKAGNPSKLLIFLNGGGACWQNFYFCTPFAEEDLGAAEDAPGIFADSFDTGHSIINNPFADWSMMFVSYCDGSVFSGDNDVVDPNYPFGPVRFHRGLRNISASMDLAKATFPNAREIMVAGASAGGVGATAFTPFLARMLYGNTVRLTVFNDAGPIAVNTDPLLLPAFIARRDDWQFDQFYPESCTDCDPLGQATALVKWRLDNDSTIRESFYSTDGDATNRFFLAVPTQEAYRAIIVPEHDALNAAHPTRYKSFIRSGDDEHTALGLDTFYLGTANGVPLWEWTRDFVKGQGNSPGWQHIVEDFVPIL